MGKRKIINLKDGAVLLYQRRRINKSACFQLFFNVGTANSEYKPGLLHFGEHLRCKQTENLSQEKCNEIMTKNAMYLNASTSLSYLSFICLNSIKKIVPTLELMVEKMLCSKLDDEIFENEKKVICNEIDRTKDDDNRNIYINMKTNILKNEFYSCNNIGEHSDIHSYNQEMVQEHIAKVINSNNLVISVAGNISLFRVRYLIKKYVMNKINTSPSQIKAMDANFEFNDTSKLSITTNTNATTHVGISFPLELNGKYFGLKEQTILNRYIMTLLNDRTGIIFKELREKNGLIYSGYADFSCKENKLHLNIQYKTNKTQIKESLKVLSTAFKNLNMSLEKMEEIKLKNKLSEDKSMPISVEQSSSKMFFTYDFYKKFISKSLHKRLYRKITLDEINEIINRLLSSQKIFVYIYGNATEEDVYTIEELENMFLNKEKIN